MEKDWFKVKAYPHIGLPFSVHDRPWIERYVNDEKVVASHAFSPFIHREVVTRKFRRKVNSSGVRSILRSPKKKLRHIYYANHLDSFIYGFYASKLQQCYEQWLDELNLSACVTAYRSISIEKGSGGSRNKCNIDYANEIFDYIRNSENKSLVVITYDIKNFFDTLNHKRLKQQWRFVLNSGRDLPADHYNLFKNLTKFSYVNEKEIFREFKNQILVETASGRIQKKSIDKRKYLKGKNAVAFCHKADLEVLRTKNYIKANKKDVLGNRSQGIPQGSPISAVLANMYMLPFDQACNEFFQEAKGVYRRYSDDMIVVCDSAKEDAAKSFIEAQIHKIALEIQKEKTQTFYLLKKDGISQCFSGKSGELREVPSHMEYLGFAFDGEYTYLKSSSLASYYRKMKRAINRSKFFSIHNKTATKGELFKSRLYKRFTYRGARRRRVYKRKPGTTNEWIISKKYDWGNYLSYALMAARVMNNNRISRQIRKHWRIFHSLLNTAPKKSKARS